MKTASHPERIVTANALSGIAALLARHHCGPRLLLVADATTWEIAGKHIAAQLADGHTVAHHIFPANVSASMEHARTLITAATTVDGLLAIGSGTINDLTKYAAAEANLPYIAVATAASMNGYTSTTASLSVDSFKHSHPAKPPRAVLADLSIIAAAPKRLTHAGLGDALCRSTVELDMMLSHFLRRTAYPQALFEKLWSHEEDLFANAAGLKEQTPKAMQLLMHALLDGGDAMTEHGSSAVASQGEHMIAHTAEMLLGDKLAHLTHGEVIALTTLTMGRLQQKLLGTSPRVKMLTREAGVFNTLFGAAAPALMQAYNQKMLAEDDIDAINYVLENSWKEITDALREVMLPPKQLQSFFEQVGIATKPEDVNIAPADYETAVNNAYLTRERFTFLDLAAMQG